MTLDWLIGTKFRNFPRQQRQQPRPLDYHRNISLTSQTLGWIHWVWVSARVKNSEMKVNRTHEYECTHMLYMHTPIIPALYVYVRYSHCIPALHGYTGTVNKHISWQVSWISIRRYIVFRNVLFPKGRQHMAPIPAMMFPERHHLRHIYTWKCSSKYRFPKSVVYQEEVTSVTTWTCIII